MTNPMSIFVVDDDKDFAESLGDILEDAGYQVSIANSGEEAVEKFKQQDFDITFMDVKMPGMNGVESYIEFCKIKPEVKVFIMTGYAMQDLLQQAIDLGAAGILQKPLNIDDVLHTLEQILPDRIILLVDDDSDFLDSTADNLRSAGYKTLLANNGQDAIDTVLAHDIHLLILDLRLPVMDGIEIYMQLKKLGRSLPTIIVTGYPEDKTGNIDIFESAEITGCLTKPFEPNELLKLVNNIKSTSIS